MSAGTLPSLPSLRQPQRWWRNSKYLFPLDVQQWLRWPARAPREQVTLDKLAALEPARVSLSEVGSAEDRGPLTYHRYFQGRCEPVELPAATVPPAYVANLRRGRVVGRHCCVIAASGQAVQETGYNVPGVASLHTEQFPPWSVRYWRKRWQGDLTSRWWLPARQTIRGSVAVLNTQHSHNYYHWLCDILPRIAPLRQLGIEPDYYLVECLSQFQRQTLAALGIAPERLIQPHCLMHLEADELLVPSLPTPACWRAMREIWSRTFNLNASSAGTRRLYVSRRKRGKRGLANDAELQAFLQERGFETHAFEDYPLARQAQLMSEAEIVVAPHGAGLANLMFARSGTRVIEIFPVGRNNPELYPSLSRALGLSHHVVLAPIIGGAQLLGCDLGDLSLALQGAVQAELPASLPATAS